MGAEVYADGQVAVGLNQNDAIGTPVVEGLSGAQLDAMFGTRTALNVVTGNNIHTRYYSDAFTIGDRAIYSGNGADVITDFSRVEGDKLSVSGITPPDGSHFHLSETDLNADGRLDTLITLDTDPTWSVKLMGYTGFNVAQDVVFG